MTRAPRLPILLLSATALGFWPTLGQARDTRPQAEAHASRTAPPRLADLQAAPTDAVLAETLPGQSGIARAAPERMAAQTSRAAGALVSPATIDTANAQSITIEAGTGILLTLPRPAGSILSAEPTIARVQPASPTSLFLMGVGAGRTTIIATSDNGAPIAQFDVTVIGGKPAAAPAPALAASPPPGPLSGGSDTAIPESAGRQVEAAIHRLIPGGTSVHATVIGGRLVLSGAVANPAAAQQVEAIARGYAGEKTVIVPAFTVLSSIQVNVRVRIAEISRTIERQLGFNWQALNNSANFRFGFLTGGAVGQSGFSPLQALGLSTAPNQLGAGFTTGKWDVNAIIDALATDQLVTILAEPNLTAQSGEPASFLAGGEFRCPSPATTPRPAPQRSPSPSNPTASASKSCPPCCRKTG